MRIEITDGGRLDGTDDASLEARLKAAARSLAPERLVDDLELRHLVRVVTGCSLLLTDVYSDERIARIMQPDRSLLAAIIDRLLEERRRGDGEVLFRVRRLPDDVRVVGDMALFDHGLRGLKRVKGYDLADLGARAYRAAGDALELLAEDRRLREFFRQNKLLVLPLEEEVGFLKQCSENFPLYAGILRHLQAGPEVRPSRVEETAERVSTMAAAAAALEDEANAVVERPRDDYLDAARGDEHLGTLLSREQLLSAYERMVLFASLDLERLRSALERTVIDQTEAVAALCDEFSLFASGTRDLRKPPAYFLVGPTGVGKNHLVESLVRILEGLWDVEIPMLTIEGPNYTYPSDINELRGATRGFIRSDEEGLLSAFHERSSRAPMSVILVDEVEKAHPQLRTFFLSILDRGTTTDNRGRVLNFANSTIFFTSNLGYSDAQQRAGQIGYLDEEARAAASDVDVKREFRRALSPEFANRLRTIHFRRLTRSSAERILDLEFGAIARRYLEVHGLDLGLDPTAREELLRLGFSPTQGARPLAAVLENVCNVEISKRIRFDDRGPAEEREALVAWLRDLRTGARAFDPNEVRRRVLEMVRARVGYSGLRIVCREGRFDYEPYDEDPA